MEVVINDLVKGEILDIYFGGRPESCCICNGGAPLSCCDNCPNTFHEHCVDMSQNKGDLFRCTLCTINGVDTEETKRFKLEHKNVYVHVYKIAVIDCLSSPNFKRGNIDSYQPQPPGCRNIAVQKRQFTSSYRGVYCRSGKWNAQIQCNGTKIYLGSFPNEIQAALAYDLAAVKLHKERAVTNFIRSGNNQEDEDTTTNNINNYGGSDNTLDFTYEFPYPLESPTLNGTENFESAFDQPFPTDDEFNGKRPRKRRNVKSETVTANEEDNLSETLNSIISKNYYLDHQPAQLSKDDIDYNNIKTESNEDITSNALFLSGFDTTNNNLSENTETSDSNFQKISKATEDIHITDYLADSPINPKIDGNNIDGAGNIYHDNNNIKIKDEGDKYLYGNNEWKINNTGSIDEYNNTVNRANTRNHSNVSSYTDVSSFSNVDILNFINEVDKICNDEFRRKGNNSDNGDDITNDNYNSDAQDKSTEEKNSNEEGSGTGCNI